jgi:hypothetical protein
MTALQKLAFPNLLSACLAAGTAVRLCTVSELTPVFCIFVSQKRNRSSYVAFKMVVPPQFAASELPWTPQITRLDDIISTAWEWHKRSGAGKEPKMTFLALAGFRRWFGPLAPLTRIRKAKT